MKYAIAAIMALSLCGCAALKSAGSNIRVAGADIYAAGVHLVYGADGSVTITPAPQPPSAPVPLTSKVYTPMKPLEK